MQRSRAFCNCWVYVHVPVLQYRMVATIFPGKLQFVYRQVLPVAKKDKVVCATRCSCKPDRETLRNLWKHCFLPVNKLVAVGGKSCINTLNNFYEATSFLVLGCSTFYWCVWQVQRKFFESTLKWWPLCCWVICGGRASSVVQNQRNSLLGW